MRTKPRSLTPGFGFFSPSFYPTEDCSRSLLIDFLKIIITKQVYSLPEPQVLPSLALVKPDPSLPPPHTSPAEAAHIPYGGTGCSGPAPLSPSSAFGG